MRLRGVGATLADADAAAAAAASSAAALSRAASVAAVVNEDDAPVPLLCEDEEAEERPGGTPPLPPSSLRDDLLEVRCADVGPGGGVARELPPAAPRRVRSAVPGFGRSTPAFGRSMPVPLTPCLVPSLDPIGVDRPDVLPAEAVPAR